MYYFGCIRQAGHYLWESGGGALYRCRVLPQDWPFGENGWSLDRKFCPNNAQTQSSARLVHVDGWTVLAMWDRTVDKRWGCNANFVERGELSFEQMVEKAKESFPTVWERINKATAVTLTEEK